MIDTEEPIIVKKSNRMGEILELLKDGRARSVQELSRRFGVPPRSIQRDLKDLSKRHSIQATDEPIPRYSVPITASSLTPVEALAAHAALRLLYHHNPDRPRSFQRALEKLASSLPQSVRHIAQHSVQIDEAPRSDDRALELVARAWVEQRVIAFDYIVPGGSGKPRRNELEVLFVEVSRSNLELYVIGRRRNWQPAIRTYRLALIENIVMLDESYMPEASFDPRRFLSNAWGVIGDANPITVKLRFNASVRAWLDPKRYPGVIERQGLADGDVILTIRTGTNSDGWPTELISWIRGWGPNVEVLEPARLRERWLSDAREVLYLYGGAP